MVSAVLRNDWPVPLVLLSLGSATCAASAQSIHETPIHETPVRVTPIHGESVQLAEFVLEGKQLSGTTLRQRQHWQMALEELWLLERSGVEELPQEPSGGSFVSLRNGPRLEARLLGGTEDAFRFEFEGLGQGLLPRIYLKGFRLSAPEGSDGGFLAKLEQPPVDHDLVFIRVKDKVRRFRMEVLGAAGEKLLLRSEQGERQTVALERVYGVVFGELAGVDEAPELTGTVVRLRLADGRALRCQLLAGSSSAGLLIRPFPGLELRVPLGKLGDLEAESERLVYLSSMQPVREERTPQLSRTWPLLRDRGLGGAPLRLGDRCFRKGFLLVPNVDLEFELPRRFTQLLGAAGMPAAQVGSARLRFLSDGRPLGDWISLQPGAAVLEIALPLEAGMRNLGIELRGGEDLDAGTVVILGDLRLVTDT
ncbi:MAG: NPCBM/NEW2 domain-containing protein [Planctomycetota bacterium]